MRGLYTQNNFNALTSEDADDVEKNNDVTEILWGCDSEEDGDEMATQETTVAPPVALYLGRADESLRAETPWHAKTHSVRRQKLRLLKKLPQQSTLIAAVGVQRGRSGLGYKSNQKQKYMLWHRGAECCGEALGHGLRLRVPRLMHKPLSDMSICEST